MTLSQLASNVIIMNQQLEIIRTEAVVVYFNHSSWL